MMKKRTRPPHQDFMTQIRQRFAVGEFLQIFGYSDDDIPTDGDPDHYPCDFYCNPEHKVLFAILDDYTKLQKFTVQHLFDLALEFQTVPQEQYNQESLKKMKNWNCIDTLTVPIAHEKYESILKEKNRESAIEQLRTDLSGIKSNHKQHVFQYNKSRMALKVALAVYIAKDELGDSASSRDVTRVFLGYDLKAALSDDDKSMVKETSDNIIRTYLKRLEMNRYFLSVGSYFQHLPHREVIKVYEDVIFDRPFTEIKLKIR